LGEQRRWHGETERIGSLAIDDEFELGFGCSSWVTSMASRITALISRHSLRGGAFFDQRTGAVNDVAGVHSVLDDTSEQPPDCFRIWRLREEQPQSGFGVHDDSADRLVDLGNRRR